MQRTHVLPAAIASIVAIGALCAACGAAPSMAPLATPTATASTSAVPTAAAHETASDSAGTAVAAAASADLPAAAERFAQALITQDYAVLLTAFTPEGLAKAQDLQTQLGGQAGASTVVTGFTLGPIAGDGGDMLVDIVLDQGEVQSTLHTRWQGTSGRWLVADLVPAQ